MELIVTILTAFPIGFLVRNRSAGWIAFIAVHGFVFVFQTLELVLEWVGGSTEAFGGPYPEYAQNQVWAYGVVNLVIFAAGLGLVALGQRVARRRAERNRGVRATSLDPVG